MTIDSKEREALRNAQRDLNQAERALEAARAAGGRARDLFELILREAEDHEAAEMRVSSSLATEMKAALMAGTGAAVSVAASDREMVKTATARATLETRRRSAEQVIAEFAGEEREREEAVARARKAVGEAIRSVLRETARQISAQWKTVEAEALVLRERLGRINGAVWKLGGIDAAPMQANSDRSFNDSDRVIENQWIEFGAALVRDPEARIDFKSFDAARAAECEERENHRRRTEEVVARMRASQLAEAHP